MQALVLDPGKPEGVRFVPDRPIPRPASGEVRIDVRLAGICATDLELTRGYMDFAGVPGHEFVGVVSEGPHHLLGRRVVAEINCVCNDCDLCRRGLKKHCRNRSVVGIVGRDGAFAGHLVVPATNCHVVPGSLSDEAAVFVEPLAAAAEVLRHARFDGDTRVALLGTGRLGLLIAQVLAQTKAELRVVGRNPRTLGVCATWGLTVCDATTIPPVADFDVVIECTGAPEGLQVALRLLRPTGTLILKSTYAGGVTLDLAPLVIHEQRVVGSRCGDFPTALRLLEAGRVQVAPLISRRFPLARGAEAFSAARDPQNIKVLLHPE